MPKCAKCKLELPEDRFWVYQTKKGKPFFFRFCKSCNLLERGRRRKELREWTEQLRSQQGCRNCGTRDHRCLEFHHLGLVAKEAGISKLVASGAGKKRLLKEIAKCEVLCANCHKILHYNARYTPS